MKNSMQGDLKEFKLESLDEPQKFVEILEKSLEISWRNLQMIFLKRHIVLRVLNFFQYPNFLHIADSLTSETPASRPSHIYFFKDSH